MDHGLRSTGENKSYGHQVYTTRAGSRKGLISRFRAFGVFGASFHFGDKREYLALERRYLPV
jgi:hypothetical protein